MNYKKRVEEFATTATELEKKYNLKDPCVHHLSDSPEHQKLYAEYRKQLKNKPTQTKEIIKTKGLYD